MFIQYLIFSFFITFFTFLESASKKYKYGMLLSFILLFIFISIRYDFGNDYEGYLYNFNRINSLGDIKGSQFINLETGWIFLTRTFKDLGFQYLVAFLSLLYCIIIYFFIRNVLEKKYLFLGLLCFLLNSGIFLINLSAMRQTLALILFLFSIKFIIERKIILYVLIIYLASLFHGSAIILLPLYFIRYFKLNKTLNIIYFVVYLSFFFISDKFVDIIKVIILFIKPAYAIYTEDENNVKTVIGSGSGVIFSSINFILLLYFSSREKFENKYLEISIKLIVIFFILMPFALSIGMIGRVNFYFSFFTIFMIPYIYVKIKHLYLKKLFLFLNLLLLIYGLNQFFNSDIYKEKFNDYKTIFSIEALNKL